MKKNFLISAFACVALLCFSCTEKETTPKSDLALAHTLVGKVIADKNGKTLYFFSSDIAGGIQCTGGCLDKWPVFYQEKPLVSSELVSTDFSTITRTDGIKQTAYKGWPLYYHIDDKLTGDIVGDNSGKVWFAAKPIYNLMVGNVQLLGMDGKNYLSDYKEGTGKTPYLMDSEGRTLYAFANDKLNKNNYTKADFSNDGVWPIAQITDYINLPSGYTAADFGIIDVFGKKQLTYRGWPLYYFGSDNNVKGATKGVSVPKPGVWPIVNTATIALK